MTEIGHTEDFSGQGRVLHPGRGSKVLLALYVELSKHFM